MNVIVGNGISAYIIAACLNYQHKDFTIRSNRKMMMPSIMLLKYQNTAQLKFYFDIFNIEYNEENIAKYCKKIKVGYLYKDKIYDSLNDEMKQSYLIKQNRNNTSSALSDNTQNFNAILLHKIAEKLQQDYSKYVQFDEIELKNNTIFDTNKSITFNEDYFDEYIVNECDIDLLDYDYIYDCNLNSPIKRYSMNCTEYITKPEKQHFHIINYYNSPKIYDVYDVKNNTRHVYISRNATQTQVKQEDIIKYMFKENL